MANICKISLLLIILAFEEANGRPPTKGIKDGKFVYGQPSVSKKKARLIKQYTNLLCFSK